MNVHNDNSSGFGDCAGHNMPVGGGHPDPNAYGHGNMDGISGIPAPNAVPYQHAPNYYEPHPAAPLDHGQSQSIGTAYPPQATPAVPTGYVPYDANTYPTEQQAYYTAPPADSTHVASDALQDQLAQLSSLVYYDSGSINANTNFSLFYHNAFTQKLRFEMANMMIVADHYTAVFDTLQSVAQLFSESGFAGLPTAKSMTNSQFMKNLLTLMGDSWPENAEHTPFARAMYWVLPTLLSGASRDRTFIENTLYYEGLLMIACGNYTYNMVQFRLLGLLGIQLSLEECLAQD
ncbi:MAG: hypothetical protein FWE06_01375 [Oscillospiraceae bacterium]|nr:hypothetical protein [Oscillospiraceae bacterium]